MSDRPLTPKEQQFVAEYLVDRNGAAAARSAKVTAARLLTKANVRMAIAEGTHAAVERTEIDADWLTDRYRAAHAAAAGQYSAAVKALDSLAKLKGLVPDQRLIHGGDAKQPLTVQVTANHVHDLPPTGPPPSSVSWPTLVRSRPDLVRLATPRMPWPVPRQPTVKQRAFLLYGGLEAFFGGAGGGGKSDALLVAAL